MVPRLYFVPESELVDDGVSAMSVATFKESMLSMEQIPFLWAQSLHLITGLTSKSRGLGAM